MRMNAKIQSNPEKQLEVNQLMKKIQQAEELRVKAANDNFNDKLYQQALEIVKAASEKVQLDQENPEKLPSQEIAVLAHLYLMISTIQQSRAKHVFKENSEKQEVLTEASAYLEKAEKLVTILSQRNYFYAADETPFPWPVEIARSQARIAERWPADPAEAQEYLTKALELYQKAMTEAEKISANEELPPEVRWSALMALGTARIEATLVDTKLRPPEQEEVWKEFNQALEELNRAWEEGYENWDRFDAGCDRMLKTLTKEEKYQNKTLIQEIKKARVKVLEQAAQQDPIAQERLENVRKALSQESSLLTS